ncbi:MAG TPA: radical SAM family heme chaperone HemW [Planctomycetaceae bacterium]|jgi:oxygen-independent coproporphyrinogen-3 oxidase|nr:radical SAM family heme chaperone HemW [Planctomycetaceae bacterium]
MTNLLETEPRSAYIHVPFCVHRCGYCDFTLVARRDDLIDAYLEALAIDLARLERPREVDTLFFGGGTPTHLPAPQLARLMSLARRWFPPAPGAEICVEANPAGLDDDKVAVLADAGVNRVSLGVQSFDTKVLELLERDHRGSDIPAVVERVRRSIPNLGLDLIFGVPGQTLELWGSTLRAALELQPTHLSTYGLTFEKGTAFQSRLNKGLLHRCDEESEREMYALTMDELPRAGFEQYELSNFARPGFRCRHNEVYWAGRPFFGFGPGAARYARGRRELNHRSVTTWINRVLAGHSPIADSEELSPEERARELVMLNLRRCDGLALAEFREQTGFDFPELAGEALPRHLRQGLLEECDGRVRLTREGRFLADTVFAEYL